MSFTRFVARSMLGSLFISGGLNAVRNSEKLAPAAETLFASLPREVTDVLPEVSAETLAKINGVTMIAAGSALSLGILPRIASTVLAAQLLPTTVAGHRFWEKEGPARFSEKNSFQKNLALAGGLLLVALGGTKAAKKKD